MIQEILPAITLLKLILPVHHGGTTFTNELVSTQPSTTNVPNSDVRLAITLILIFVGGNIVPVWTDERAGGFDMDIYTVSIKFR